MFWDSKTSTSENLERLLKRKIQFFSHPIVSDKFITNCPPHCCYIRFHDILNIHKGGSIFFFFALMILCNNFSLGAILYTALHGGYGLLWMMKYIYFRDDVFEMKMPLGSNIIACTVLLCYWMIGGSIILGYGI
jgi:hypothetical protein